MTAAATLSRSLRYALLYASQLWRVFPIAFRSKVPAIRGGRGCLDATTDSEQITRWWAHWSDAGVGIATGPGSGLVVLDVDPRNAGDETLAALERLHGKLPQTPRALTGGGGQHYLFRWPAGVARLAGRLGDGLDIKADGGYIVAAPSVHPETGAEYRWDLGAMPSEIPLADMPSWMLSMLVQADPLQPRAQTIEGGSVADSVLGEAFMLAGMLGDTLPNGLVAVVCPWSHEHSDDRGRGRDSSTVLFPPTSDRRIGGFLCLHAHCAGRDSAQVFDALPREAVLAARRKFRQHIVPVEPPPEFDSGVHETAPEARWTPEDLAERNPRCTDSANADAFVKRFGDAFRWVTDWECWIVWTGEKWSRSEAVERAIAAIRDCAREEYADTAEKKKAIEEKIRVAQLKQESDKVEQLGDLAKALDGLLRWHQQSQNASRLSACLLLSRSGLCIVSSVLDSHPWLFNVSNGTLDLQTAQLRPHRRSDYLTQQSSVAWDDDASCPTWNEFLRTSTNSDTHMVCYLARAVGYSLTGLTKEQVLFFCHGEGSNGKGTFTNTLKHVFGDYACAASRSLLMVQAFEPHPTELARLAGKRMATCAEVNDDDRLHEAKVKDLTGSDVLSARRMNENFWDLTPTHKLWLSGNHRPTITGTDHGIWRRMRLIPWTVKFEDAQKDTDLPQKLLSELPGILRWAVHGCLEWQRIGLADPESVKLATSEYRDNSDVFGQFLSECCRLDSELRCKRAALRESYEAWCSELGHKPMGARRIAERLRERGVVDSCLRDGPSRFNGWRGIGLL